MPATRRSAVRGVLCALALAGSATLGPALSSAAADSVSSGSLFATSPAPTIALSSEVRGSPSDISFDVNLTYPHSGDTLEGLTAALAPGMSIDAAAPGATCSASQLSAGSCPAGAVIGSGVADVTLTNPVAAGIVGGGGAQTLSITLYALPASGSDTLGVGAVFSDAALGTRSVASGEITQVVAAGTPSQATVSLDGFPTSLESGALGGLTQLRLDALALKLDGQAVSAGGSADAGTPFITLPETCTPATIAITANTEAAAAGTLSDTFTPTGCPAPAPQPSLGFGFVLHSGSGSQRLDSLKLRLPKGLSFSASALGGALEVHGASDRFQLDHGVLVIELAHVSPTVAIEVEAAGVRVSPGAPDRPRITVTVSREHGKATNLHFTLGLQR